MTRATAKPRKPREMHMWPVCWGSGWSVRPSNNRLLIFAAVFNLADARRLHAWLGRYIAWREWLIERRRLKNAA